jgi:hypothetical protein
MKGIELLALRVLFLSVGLIITGLICKICPDYLMGKSKQDLEELPLPITIETHY